MSYKKIQESTVDSSDITVKEEVDDSDHWVGDVQLQMLVSEGGGHAAPNDPTIDSTNFLHEEEVKPAVIPDDDEPAVHSSIPPFSEPAFPSTSQSFTYESTQSETMPEAAQCETTQTTANTTTVITSSIDVQQSIDALTETMPEAAQCETTQTTANTTTVITASIDIQQSIDALTEQHPMQHGEVCAGHSHPESPSCAPMLGRLGLINYENVKFPMDPPENHEGQESCDGGPCEPVFEEPQPQSAVPMANENDVDSVPESPQRGSEDGPLESGPSKPVTMANENNVDSVLVSEQGVGEDGPLESGATKPVPMANENDVDFVPESPQRGSEDEVGHGGLPDLHKMNTQDTVQAVSPTSADHIEETSNELESSEYVEKPFRGGHDYIISLDSPSIGPPIPAVLPKRVPLQKIADLDTGSISGDCDDQSVFGDQDPGNDNEAESEAAQANSDTSTSWHSVNLIAKYTVDCTDASRTDASRTDASPSVSRQRSPKRKLKKARRLSSSGDDEYVPPTKQRKQAKHKKRRHKSLKRHKEKRSRHVSTNRKSKKRRTEKDQRTAAKSTAESTASTQLHDVDEASTNQTSKKRRTEKDRRTAAKPTAKATASTQLHDVDEAQHEAESSHIDEQNTKRARSARSKQAQRTAKPKRGRPPIDRQKYYNEFPEIDPALYDTLTRNQFHCRISRLRMLKKLSQNPIAKRSYLDAEAKRAKINRMKRKSERDARNPSQARARSNWTEAKKLNPQRETLTVKQSYVRQKTTTKCLAGDMVVLEQKFDVCQLELKAAKKQIEALKNQQSELESSQDTLVGMVQNYRNRTRNALTKATTSEERISAQLEHLRRARETDIQLIYLAPDLAFPDDFEVGTGDECEDLPGDEKLEDPFLYSWLLKQGPTAMNPYAPKHDKLPKGYMGRAPDSDESSCADYDSSFVDDEEFEGDGSEIVEINDVRSFGYGLGTAGSTSSEQKKKNEKIDILMSLCTGQIKKESCAKVTELEAKFNIPPATLNGGIAPQPQA